MDVHDALRGLWSLMFGPGMKCERCGALYWILSLHTPSCKGKFPTDRLDAFFANIDHWLNRPTV